MQINPLITRAAKAAAAAGVDITATGPVEIPGYQGMFVASSTEANIQAMDFFELNGDRYVVGPKKKST